MQLEQIISISGKPGLFKLITQLKNGFIVEDVSTKRKFNIGNTSQVSLLDNISIYTTTQEVPLFQVFKNIAEKENYGQAISHKSDNDTLKSFLAEVLPEYDRERVYVSDMKKMVLWYNILQEAGFISEEGFKAREEALKATEEN